VKLTVEPVIEQNDVAELSIVKVTGLPEPPPVAVTEYVAPATAALLGTVEVKAIACAP
jgi:hypothetical protein